MRKATYALVCDFCSAECATDKEFTKPVNWLEVVLELPDNSHPLSATDLVHKTLCTHCAKQTEEAIFPLKVMSMTETPQRAQRSAEGGIIPTILEMRADCIVWLAMGGSFSYPSFADVAEAFPAGNIEVDAGYRTAEVLEACRNFGWKAFKMVRGLHDSEPRKCYLDLATGEVLP